MVKNKEAKPDEKAKKMNTKKKKEKIKLSKEIDMLKFKQKINKEMGNIPIMRLDNFVQLPSSKQDPISIYSNRYKEYINQEISILCTVFINRLINESTTLPLEIKNTFNIHKILMEIVKQLFMNEYEIALFSLFLDLFGWVKNGIKLETNCFFIGLILKQFSNESDFQVMLNYFSQINKDFHANFEKWKTDNQDKVSYLFTKAFSYSEVNSRFSAFKKPFNIYCKTNYIDYNSVVDKILRMSLPYSENKQKEEEQSEENVEGESHINKSENKTIFNLSGNKAQYSNKICQDTKDINTSRQGKRNDVFTYSEPKQKEIKIENKPIPKGIQGHGNLIGNNNGNTMNNTIMNQQISLTSMPNQGTQKLDLQSMYYPSYTIYQQDPKEFQTFPIYTSHQGIPLNVTPKVSQSIDSVHEDFEGGNYLVPKTEQFFGPAASLTLKNYYDQTSVSEFLHVGPSLMSINPPNFEETLQVKRPNASNKSFTLDNLLKQQNEIQTNPTSNNPVNFMDIHPQSSLSLNMNSNLNNNNLNQTMNYNLNAMNNNSAVNAGKLQESQSTHKKNLLGFYQSMKNQKNQN